MKIYRNKEEMLKKDREEFLNSDINIKGAVRKQRRRRIKKILKVLIFIITVIVLFKVLIGVIRINKEQPNRGYELYVNNETIRATVIEEYNEVVVPNFMEFYDYNEFMIGEENLEVNIKKGGSLYLKVKEYACYTKDNILKQCNNKVARKEYFGYPNSHYTILIQDDEMTVLYEGELTTEDYSKYLKDGKISKVSIYGGYENVKATISFYATKE